MLISENERFRQEINTDQRHSSFSAHFQLVLDRTKPIPSFWRRKWKLPCQSVFNENKLYSRQHNLVNKTDKTGLRPQLCFTSVFNTTCSQLNILLEDFLHGRMYYRLTERTFMHIFFHEDFSSRLSSILMDMIFLNKSLYFYYKFFPFFVKISHI
jgi:hypothetical protein